MTEMGVPSLVIDAPPETEINLEGDMENMSISGTDGSSSPRIFVENTDAQPAELPPSPTFKKKPNGERRKSLLGNVATAIGSRPRSASKTDTTAAGSKEATANTPADKPVMSKMEYMKKLFSWNVTSDDSSDQSSRNSSVRSSPRASDADIPANLSNPTLLQAGSNNSPLGSKGSNLDISSAGTTAAKPRRKSSLIKMLGQGLVGGSKTKDHGSKHGIPELNLDDIINRLIESAGQNFDTCVVTPEEIEIICKATKDITMSQPILLQLVAPLQICGDIHGQFSDLIDLFEKCGDPADTSYLFLGDYVDRGKQSMETILLLMCYKVKYPETFFLLRGNHETSNINRVYGFFDECKRKSKMKIWKEFTNFFDTLPLAAIVSKTIFCVHGGLSPILHSLDSIREIKRPCNIGHSGVAADLLWSDPHPDAVKWEVNEDRGLSFVFGPPQIDNFLQKFNLELIVRAHMVVEDGYEFFYGRKLVTIFSAPNYCGSFDNKGAIMKVDTDLQVSFKFLIPEVSTKLERSASQMRKDSRGI